MTSARTLQSLLDSLSDHGEKPALLALGKKELQRWSFAKLAHAAQLFANGLVANGIKRGDSVALFAENRPEWIAAAIGILRAGAVALPLDVQFGDQTLVHVLDDSAARAVITTQRRVERIEKLALKQKPTLIVLDAPPGDARELGEILSPGSIRIATR